MQRLTRRSTVDNGFATISTEIAEENFRSPWQIIDLLVLRLAEYEELGATPEEIRGIIKTHEALKKKALPLMTLATEGRLLKAPKIGHRFYEADQKRGVVMHEVKCRHWMVDTEATDGDGNKWAEQWTDENYTENAFEDDKAAMKHLLPPTETEDIIK